MVVKSHETDRRIHKSLSTQSAYCYGRKKLEYEFIGENVWSEATTINLSNPLGKVPCLVMEAGEAIFDSRVIYI